MITKDLPVYNVHEDRFVPQEQASAPSGGKAKKSAAQAAPKKQG